MRELSGVTGLPAAASFKHVSPAGAAVYAEIDDEMLEVYEAKGKELSKTAVAYLRSRQADPLCSFGDFVAVSEVVDLSTAQLLKIEVSDGNPYSYPSTATPYAYPYRLPLPLP